MNCKDAPSPYCQRVKGVVMERLDRFDNLEVEVLSQPDGGEG
jgi:hypothetical protein